MRLMTKRSDLNKNMKIVDRDCIDIAYLSILSRTASDDEIETWLEQEISVDVLIKQFIVSEEFVGNKEGIIERLERLVEFLVAYREADWVSAKVHVTSHYMRYCDWTRFVEVGIAPLLEDAILDGVVEQESRIVAWMLDARELYSNLEKFHGTFDQEMNNVKWQIGSLSEKVVRVEQAMNNLAQHSPSGDRALMTEILLRLDRLTDQIEGLND